MITDELRKWKSNIQTYLSPEAVLHLRCEVNDIADRIDIAHKHAIGYVDDRDPETMAENGWVRLPVDADGVPICVGDVMDKGKVTCIRNCGKGWEVILNSLYTYDASSLHHREPTVEDVLREMMRDAACQFNDDGSCCVGLTDKQLAEYAQRLQLREES